MTAVSWSLGIDANDMSPQAFTQGTLAPNAGDVELRVSLTNTPTRKQVDIILKNLRRLLSDPVGSNGIANI